MSHQFCKKCGSPIKQGFKFCEKCGEPVPVAPAMPREEGTVLLHPQKCNVCGKENMTGAKFCEKCGAPMGATPMGAAPTGGAPMGGENYGSGRANGGSETVKMNPGFSGGSNTMNASKQNSAKKNGGGQLAIIIVLIVVLLAVIGVGAILIINVLKKGEEVETGIIEPGEGNETTEITTGENNPYADPELEPSKLPENDDPSKHVYELVKADITWSEAERLAEEKGGYLACISDSNEEGEIVNYLNNYSDLKIVYIGAKRGTKGFKWVSGEKFVYYNWADGEPNNYNDIENFVCLYNKDGKSQWTWNDCTDNMYAQGGGQFTGYTAYLIEYNSESDKKSSADNNNQTTNESGASDTAN